MLTQEDINQIRTMIQESHQAQIEQSPTGPQITIANPLRLAILAIIHQERTGTSKLNPPMDSH